VRKIVFLLAMMVLLVPASYTYAFSTTGQDCAKCHTLTKDEAVTLLKDLIPNLKVLDVVTSPMKGMWEVDVVANGKKGLVYVDFTKKYLISGSLVDIKEKKNVSQERLADISRVDVSTIPLGDAVVMGDKDAKYKIIVFSDPD